MRKWIRFIYLFLFVPLTSFADEIVGGDLKYEISQEQQLYLDVYINKVSLGLHSISYSAPDFLVTNQTLSELGLKFQCDIDPCSLASFPFERVDYQVNAQVLNLEISDKAVNLPINQLNKSEQREKKEARSDKGIVLNYDLIMNHNNNEHDISYGAFTNARLFGNRFALNSYQTSIVNKDNQASHLRYDSYLDYYSQNKLINARIGDGITQSTEWARPMRMLGLHLSRDFSLDPNYSDRPNLDFTGSVTLPSTVDLFINGTKRFFGQAPVGNFAVDLPPTFSGLGYASVIITDPLGQRTVQNKPIYYSNRLLKKNTLDWSFSAGKLRENYGINSFDYYQDTVMTGKLSMGILDAMTVDTGLQRVDYQEEGELVNTGLGITAIPHPWIGEVSTHYSISKYQEKLGKNWGLGYRWNNSKFTFGSLFSESDTYYKDIPQLYDAPLTLRSKYFYGGVSTKKYGLFSVGYFERRNKNDENIELLNGAWNINLSEQLRLSLDMNRSLTDTKDWSANLGLTYSLNDLYDMTLRTKKNDKRTLYYADATKKTKEVNGLSWNTGAVYDDNTSNWSNTYKYIETEYATDHGVFRGGINSDLNAYLGIRGALIYLDKSVYLSQPVFDSFATVDTDGVPDVPVYLNNRFVGNTNKKGKKLVTGLYSYIENEISIDTLNLPTNVSVDQIKHDVVPSRNGGVAVYYEINADASIVLKIMNENQEPIKMGTRLYIPDVETPYLVGYDGIAFIENNAKEVEVKAIIPDEVGEYDEKNQCVFTLTAYEASSSGGYNTGKVICKKRI